MRKTRESLTGGTGDVNPQWLAIPPVTTSAVNVFTPIGYPLPISRPGSSGKQKTTVIEILKVWMDMPNNDNYQSATIVRTTASVVVATSPLSTVDISDPRVIAYSTRTWITQNNAGNSLSSIEMDPWIIDVTDGAGHGILVGTDTIYVGVATSNFIGLGSCVVRILYRFKDVTLTEYIGMVQSQQ